MTEAELSVVVAIQPEQGSHYRDCLDSLTQQKELNGARIEIIAVAEPSHTRLDEIERAYPGIKTVAAAGCRSLPKLHGAGMQAAEGQLIAITEGHCIFAPDWASKAIAHHRHAASPVVAGGVEPGEKLSLLDWALFFCDYGQFIAPLTAGEAHDLPGNNIIFKSTLFSDKNQFARAGFWKTFFCHDLERKGEQLVCRPDLIVRYNRHLSLTRLTARRYHHGRCFGGMRAQESSISQRMIYALAGPILPLLLFYKLLARVLPKHNYRAQFLASLPLSLLCLSMWALGEWLGNLLGPGESCELL